MIILLIGHRGVGKTSLLKRIQMYFPKTKTCDLDREIERETGKSVAEIFKQDGEEKFRDLEEQVLEKIVQTNPEWIALGAGFELDRLKNLELSAVVKVMWVRRETDNLGRIFNNRPRLNADLSQIEESLLRFKERDPKYEQAADIIYDLPEGIFESSDIEKKILSGQYNVDDAYLTSSALSERMQKSLSFLPIKKETRTDHSSFGETKVNLLSYRKPSLQLNKNFDSSEIDWAIENGNIPESLNPTIISLHDRFENESILQATKRLEAFGKSKHLKFAPIVDSFDELWQGFEWQQQDKAKRSFLPRSKNGRWNWFRRLQKGQQKINFIRMGAGSALDQPTLFQWLSTPTLKSERKFAAVLGLPTNHSRSPVFHQSFFSRKDMPFVNIDVSADEWPAAYYILKKLGLRAAAVTAPLKNLAGGNTLCIIDNQESCFNTDADGLRQAIEFHNLSKYKSVFVWGGGGTLNSIKEVFSQADFVSVRTGKPRNTDNGPQGEIAKQYDLLVWAAGPRDSAPSKEIEFSAVLDLNYREDSEARAMASERSIPYFSGEYMFDMQALAQQKIWQEI